MTKYNNMMEYALFFIIGIVIGFGLNLCMAKLTGEGQGGVRKTIVVLISALSLTLLFQKYGLTADFIAYAFLMSLLWMVFFIDIDRRVIPDELVLAGLAGSIPLMVYNAFYPMAIYGNGKWWSPLLGILPGSGFLFLIALAGMLIYRSDEAMGMGDVKLYAPIGIFLGFRMCVFSVLLAVLLAGITSLLLMAAGIKKRKDTIPFAPFIVSATFITLLWGMDMVVWYFK